VAPQVASSAPQLVRDIAAQGHEVAVAGDWVSTVREENRERFRESARRQQGELEDLLGMQVVGYRAAGGWLSPKDLWVLDVLAEAGYRYDSSIRPALFSNPAETWRRMRENGHGHVLPAFFEVPVSSIGLFGLQVPIGGGGSFRHFPQAVTRHAVAHWVRRRAQPYVMYMRTWELDSDQPRISVASLYARLRQYRNLGRMPHMVEEVLSTYRFTGIAEKLGLGLSPIAPPEPRPQGAGEAPAAVLSSRSKDQAQAMPAETASVGVSVVIPCYNESLTLRYLSNTLDRLAETHRQDFSFTFVFVDDRSTDDTWALLQSLFGRRADCLLVRHEQNRGVAAAIQTGLRRATDEVVCSIDSDCTYDPNDLCRMIPLLTDGVDVVTASPYHPSGKVMNVPRWRLFLSRSCSHLYRMVFRQKLHTYTSCCRVYRRGVVAAVDIRLPGFLGISELLAHVDRAGGRIVEFPTTLEVRVLGLSKMRVARTIVGHLGFLMRLVGERLFRRPRLRAGEVQA
jgi:polysaccharide deacetylase family protein (PEP-CTERM system associated)